jgi:hypothetical protein
MKPLPTAPSSSVMKSLYLVEMHLAPASQVKSQDIRSALLSQRKARIVQPITLGFRACRTASLRGGLRGREVCAARI